MKNLNKGETPDEHEARMRRWKEQDEATIAAGKMITVDDFPKMFEVPYALPKFHILN
jgi:hypothetical protein